jgi:LDH2 family malate/lactate/ureidoglycolate dehydrogenase
VPVDGLKLAPGPLARSHRRRPGRDSGRYRARVTVDLSIPTDLSLPDWAIPERMRGADPAVGVPVDRTALGAFAAAALRSSGAQAVAARLTADTLLLADARGHPSHGVSRLRQYLRLVDGGAIDPKAGHLIVARRAALELWDAQRGLGPAVGHRAMARAVTRARRTGLAAVVVRGAGHFGIAGAYVLRAMEAGLIGVTLGNASPGVPPTGARAAGLGTNPIAIGAPDGAGRGFLLDMATSVVALGKVEVARRAGRAIPEGWAVDAAGRPTTDPDTALTGMMLPLGGRRETAGYKGFGLAASVDLLTGVLGGGTFALLVGGLWDTRTPASCSQLHLALDPAAVGDPEAFQARLRAWRDELTGLPRADGADEIVIAGEPEWRADERQVDRVDVLPEVVRDLASLAVERRLLRRWRQVVADAG